MFYWICIVVCVCVRACGMLLGGVRAHRVLPTVANDNDTNHNLTLNANNNNAHTQPAKRRLVREPTAHTTLGCKRMRARAAAESALFMSDTEAQEAFSSRLIRLRLTCSVCCADGWAVDEECAPRAARIMHVASCGQHTHATCGTCLKSEVDQALFSTSLSSLSSSRPPRVQCLFPFSTLRCTARYSVASTLAVASDRALNFWRGRRTRAHQHPASPGSPTERMSRDGTRALVTCAGCSQLDSVALSEFALCQSHACSNCDAVWCTRCGLPNTGNGAECLCLALPDAFVPTAFSRLFYEHDGWPRRKHEVSPADVDALNAQLQQRKQKQNEDLEDTRFYVECHACRFKLHKTSACNSLSHCNRVVCNACGCGAHPWEAHMPLDHWDAGGVAGCPQWDTDSFWNAPPTSCGYACVENDCFSDSRACSKPAHGSGIAHMNTARRSLALRRLLCEFPIPISVTQVQCSMT